MWLQCASRTVLGLVIGTVLLLTVRDLFIWYEILHRLTFVSIRHSGFKCHSSSACSSSVNNSTSFTHPSTLSQLSCPSPFLVLVWKSSKSISSASLLNSSSIFCVPAFPFPLGKSNNLISVFTTKLMTCRNSVSALLLLQSVWGGQRTHLSLYHLRSHCRL